jgi:ABC-2 type transport system ATP-binding protein
MEQPWVIDLSGVCKTFKGGIRALNGVDFKVKAGEVFGLLGPNGAGKSTLVKILMTIIRPTQCSGAMLGMPVGHKPTLARVGYLPENHRFPRYLTGRQTLEFFAAMSHVDRKTRITRANELLETVGMSKDADRKISGYSKGMMQRVGLAQSIMNDPDIILLDEPTDGVDPIGRRDIRQVIKNLRDRGKTIFINSHLLGELELICDRVAIMVKGKVLRQGTLAELSLGKGFYTIEVDGDLSRQHDVWQSLGFNGDRLLSGEQISMSVMEIHVKTDDPAIMQPLLDRLRQTGFTIKRLERMIPSLEDLFINVVENHGGRN